MNEFGLAVGIWIFAGICFCIFMAVIWLFKKESEDLKRFKFKRNELMNIQNQLDDMIKEKQLISEIFDDVIQDIEKTVEKVLNNDISHDIDSVLLTMIMNICIINLRALEEYKRHICTQRMAQLFDNAIEEE